MASLKWQFTDDNVSSTGDIYNKSNDATATVAYYARAYCKKGSSNTACGGWVLLFPGDSNLQMTVNGHSVNITIADTSKLFGACNCSGAGSQLCFDFTKVCKVDGKFTAPSDSMSSGFNTACSEMQSCSVPQNVVGTVTSDVSIG